MDSESLYCASKSLRFWFCKFWPSQEQRTTYTFDSIHSKMINLYLQFHGLACSSGTGSSCFCLSSFFTLRQLLLQPLMKPSLTQSTSGECAKCEGEHVLSPECDCDCDCVVSAKLEREGEHAYVCGCGCGCERERERECE